MHHSPNVPANQRWKPQGAFPVDMEQRGNLYVIIRIIRQYLQSISQFNTDFHRPFNRQKNNNQAVQTILSGQLLSQGILNGLASFSTPIRMGV